MQHTRAIFPQHHIMRDFFFVLERLDLEKEWHNYVGGNQLLLVVFESHSMGGQTHVTGRPQALLWVQLLTLAK